MHVTAISRVKRHYLPVVVSGVLAGVTRFGLGELAMWFASRAFDDPSGKGELDMVALLDVPTIITVSLIRADASGLADADFHYWGTVTWTVLAMIGCVLVLCVFAGRNRLRRERTKPAEQRS